MKRLNWISNKSTVDTLSIDDKNRFACLAKPFASIFLAISLVLSLIISLGNSAEAAFSCNHLFDAEVSTDINAYIGEPSQKERALISEVESRGLIKQNAYESQFGFEKMFGVHFVIDQNKFTPEQFEKSIDSVEEAKLSDALDVMESYYEVTKTLRKFNDKKIDFTKDLSVQNQGRFAAVQAGILMRVAELLASKGIRYHTATEKIYISTDGNHYLNKLAHRLKESENVDISFPIRRLIEYGASGLYVESGEISLNPGILLQDSFYQNETALHEYTHHLNKKYDKQRISRPFQGRIEILNIGPAMTQALGIYRKGFSVDEIKAYRTSLRFDSHAALTTKSEAEFDSRFARISKVIHYERLFTIITMRVMKRYLKDKAEGKLNNDNILEFSEQESYKLKKGNVFDAKSVSEMSVFTYNLYNYLVGQVNKYEQKNMDDKRSFIKKLVRVLSIQEIKELNGDYPSMDKIKMIFDEDAS